MKRRKWALNDKALKQVTISAFATALSITRTLYTIMPECPECVENLPFPSKKKTI
jgi:hypothetical protein